MSPMEALTCWSASCATPSRSPTRIFTRARFRCSEAATQPARTSSTSSSAMRDGLVPTEALATHRASLEQSPARFSDWIKPETGVIKALDRDLSRMAFPIIQFGTSRFLQAHVDLFVSEALAAGEAIGRIVAVQTTANRGQPQAHRRLRRGPALCRADQGYRGGAPLSTAKSRSEASAAASTPTRTGRRSSVCSTRRAAWSRTPRTAATKSMPRTRQRGRRPAPSRPSSQSCSSPAIAPARRRSRSFPAS